MDNRAKNLPAQNSEQEREQQKASKVSVFPDIAHTCGKGEDYPDKPDNPECDTEVHCVSPYVCIVTNRPELFRCRSVRCFAAIDILSRVSSVNLRLRNFRFVISDIGLRFFPLRRLFDSITHGAGFPVRAALKATSLCLSVRSLHRCFADLLIANL